MRMNHDLRKIIMMKKFFLLILLLLPALFFSAEAETLVLPPGTPVFRDVNLKRPPVLITEKETVCEIIGRQIYRYEKPPLMKDITFYRFHIPKQGDFLASPEVIININREKRSFFYELEQLPLMMLLGALCASGGFLLTILFFRKQNSKYAPCLPFGALIFFFCGIMLYTIGASGNIVQGQADDFAYFQIAKDIASGNFTGKWSYTVGLPLFYLPFQFILKARTLQEFYPPFLLFNCFIVTPFALCMAYRIIRKLSAAIPALSAMLLWLAMTFLYHHRYFWVGSQDLYAQYVYKSFPALPEFSFSYSLYELYTFYGYNCVSDTISTALVFACLAFILSMKASQWNLALFSALFGLACLVRVNNILFAPLMLLALYLRYAEQLCRFRQWLRFLLTGALPFLAVFSIQLAVDWIQFGNPFTLPYVLHGEATQKGFSFSMVPYGIKLLCNSNHAWFVTGTLALFFISSRRTRALLGWWIYPPVFFFFGYPMVFNNATRFILPVFAGLAAAVVLTDLWKHNSRSMNIRIVMVLLLSVFLTAPVSSPRLAHLLPWNLQKYGESPQSMQFIQYFILILSLLIFLTGLHELWEKRKNQAAFRYALMPTVFLGAFLLLFYWANPYATAFVMLCAFLRTLYDTILLIREKIRTVPAEYVSEDSGLT